MGPQAHGRGRARQEGSKECPAALGGAAVDNIPLDTDLYARICDDLARSGGAFVPADVWTPQALWPESEAVQRAPAFDDLIEPWLGGKARGPVTAPTIEACQSLLASLDATGAMTEHFRQWMAVACRPSIAHARTALEYALIMGHLGAGPGAPVRVLEIGGGYGRLAECFLRLGGGRVTYLLLDAVPASLYYAHAYLQRVLPEHSIGLYYLDPDADVGTYDCYVAPMWHMERFLSATWDVGVNVASMQEMRADQVELTLDGLDRAVRQDGLLFLSNSRDYIYRHEYRYPASWELVVKRNTPFSWSPHYPVEVLRKRACGSAFDNAPREATYLAEVAAAYRAELDGLRSRYHEARERLTAAQRARVEQAEAAHHATVERLRTQLAARDETVQRLRRRIEELSEARDRARSASVAAIARLRAVGDQRRERIAALTARIEKLQLALERTKDSRDRLAASHAARVERLEAELASREEAIDRLTARLTGAEGRSADETGESRG